MTVRLGENQQGILRWLPSLSSIAFLLPLVLLYWQLDGPTALLTDPQTGVHVQTGLWILNHQTIPRHDMFSFTLAGRAWLDWEWLSDVAFGFLNRWHGLAAVAALSLTVLCLTSGVIYPTARLCAGRAVAFGTTCLVMATSTIHWVARPHLFSWLFLAVSCWAIEQARLTDSRKSLLLLPVLMVAWGNLHAGFVAGIGVLAGWFGASAACALIGRKEDCEIATWNWARWLGLTAVACLIATLLNPYGIELHQHIFSYLLLPGSVTTNIVEWMSPDFHNPRLHWFELLLPLIGAAALWHGLRCRFAWCALTLGGLHLALTSVRNVPICGILCAAPVAGMIEEMVGQSSFGIRLQQAEQTLARSRSRVAAVCSYGVTLLLLILVVYNSSLQLHPVPALTGAALAHLPEGRLFTTDTWADYLIYAQPGRTVFFDCRNDFYGPELLKTYRLIMEARPGWEGLLSKYGISGALVPKNSALSAALRSSLDWEVSYQDETAEVFQRRYPALPFGALDLRRLSARHDTF